MVRPGMELLERKVKRTALENLFIGAMGLLLLAASVGGLVFAPAVVLKDAAAALFAIPAFAAFSSVMLKRAWELWPAHESVVCRALRDDPRDLVWVHETTGMFNALTLNFRNGRFYRVHASEAERRVLLDFALRRAPHALVGYDDHVRRQYRALVREAAKRP